MAAATVMTDSELGKSLSDAREKLSKAERLLKETEDRIVEVSDELAILQARRADECHELALGRKADPAKFDALIRNAEDKLTGLEAVKRMRERDLADLKTTFYSLEAEWAKIKNKQADERELQEIQKLIAEAKNAVLVRNESERIFLDALTKLRSRKYRVERNRQLAFGGAEAAQRNWNGMRA